jgi:hypothetical protein
MKTVKLTVTENELSSLFQALSEAKTVYMQQSLSHENETIRKIARKQADEVIDLLGAVANKLSKLGK